MIIDQQDLVGFDGVVCFPDFSFGNLPSKPSSIKESPQVIGKSKNAAAITGNIGTSQPGPSIIFPVS